MKTFPFLLFLFSLALPVGVLCCEVAAMVRDATAPLGLRVLRELVAEGAAEGGKSLIVAPTALLVALAQAITATDSHGLRGLARAAGVENARECLRESSPRLDSIDAESEFRHELGLAVRRAGGAGEGAAGLLVDRSLKITPVVALALRQSFGEGPLPVPFARPFITRRDVNEWVTARTGGAVTGLQVRTPRLGGAALLSALSLDLTFESPDFAVGRARPFALGEDSPGIHVDYFVGQGQFRFNEDEKMQCVAVPLKRNPLGEHRSAPSSAAGVYQALFVLPRSHALMGEVLEELIASPTAWRALAKDLALTEVKVSIPALAGGRGEVETMSHLTKALRKLGYNSERHPLSRLSPGREVVVEEVEHFAALTLGRGLRDHGRDGVDQDSGQGPTHGAKEFKADKPFILIVLDIRREGAAILTALITNPTKT
jgi:hypothetical protein